MTVVWTNLEDAEDEGNNPVRAPLLMHIQEMHVNVGTREMFVNDEIETDFGEWFTVALRYLESRSDDPITIWINTPGGDVQSMFTFHDVVKASKCEIVTVGIGQVCSAGVLMLACGDRRLVTESCVLMSHRGDEELSGHLEQIEAQFRVVRWMEDRWSELMARYTPDQVDGKDRDKRYWFNLGKKTAEWWVTGGDAIVHEGLADQVYHHQFLPDPARRHYTQGSKEG